MYSYILQILVYVQYGSEIDGLYSSINIGRIDALIICSNLHVYRSKKPLIAQRELRHVASLCVQAQEVLEWAAFYCCHTTRRTRTYEVINHTSRQVKRKKLNFKLSDHREQ